jgi:hypothetical protein
MTTPNSQERGSSTSASNAQADSLCAGRHLAQRGCADMKTEDAAYGTLIHEALKKQDPAGLTLEQQEIYAAIQGIEQRKLEDYFGADVGTSKPVAVRERRYWCEWSNGFRHSGMIDVHYTKGTRAIIFEYKSLQGDVAESPKNLQLRDQACLLAAGNPLLNEIAVCVIQPLHTWTPEICVYKSNDIIISMAMLHDRVAKSNDPKSPRTPGDIQCKFCIARLKCAEHNKWAGQIVAGENPVAVSLLETACSEWTPQQRVLFLDRMPIAQKWLDDCKSEMKRLIKENPEAIPGYELKAGAKRELITDPQGVFERFSTKGGSLEQFMRCISVAKGALKEQLAAVTKSKGKKLDEELRGLTEGKVEVKENEPSLKRKEA